MFFCCVNGGLYIRRSLQFARINFQQVNLLQMHIKKKQQSFHSPAGRGLGKWNPPNVFSLGIQNPVSFDGTKEMGFLKKILHFFHKEMLLEANTNYFRENRIKRGSGRRLQPLPTCAGDDTAYTTGIPLHRKDIIHVCPPFYKRGPCLDTSCGVLQNALCSARPPAAL